MIKVDSRVEEDNKQQMFDIGFTEDMSDIFTSKRSLEERVKDIRSNTTQLISIVNPVKCRNN